MFDILSTRESATILWVIFILAILLLYKKIRLSMFKVLKCALKLKLIILFAIITFYYFFTIYFFYKSSFWNNIFIKDLVFTFLFVVVPQCFNSIGKNNLGSYIKNNIKNNFGLIVLAEFITSTFTFNIYIELFLFPFIVILTIIQVLIENKFILPNEKNSALKFIIYLQSVIGISMISHSIFLFSTTINNYNNLELLITFFIPIFYSIITIPITYMTSIYSVYEDAFLRLSLKEKPILKLKIINRLKIVLKCKLSHRKIYKFSTIHVFRLNTSTSPEEFNIILKEL